MGHTEALESKRELTEEGRSKPEPKTGSPCYCATRRQRVSHHPPPAGGTGAKCPCLLHCSLQRAGYSLQRVLQKILQQVIKHATQPVFFFNCFVLSSLSLTLKPSPTSIEGRKELLDSFSSLPSFKVMKILHPPPFFSPIFEQPSR